MSLFKVSMGVWIVAMGHRQVKCHGDDARFEILANFVYDRFGNSIKYIADVAGGQGVLSRILNKKFNYEAEVIDPREHQLKGISNRQCEYEPNLAGYYDLIIGLHPDEATRAVAESAFYKPTIVVPCCNFWDRSQKLGTKALVDAICDYYKDNHIIFETCQFDFKGPKNIGIITSGVNK